MIRKLLFSLLVCSLTLASSKVGVAIKVKGDVSLTPAESENKSDIKPGNPLHDQDMIQTGKTGFVAAMYLDDRTVIKIGKNTEFIIGGNRNIDGIDKSVAINYGTMLANVARQKGKEFIVATPTSIASVKGTEFIVVSDPSIGDSFIIIEGLVEVINNVTGEKTEVRKGETAISTPKGDLDVVETIEEEIPNIEEVFIEPEEEEGNDLQFEVEDDEGNIQKIIIKYR